MKQNFTYVVLSLAAISLSACGNESVPYPRCGNDICTENEVCDEIQKICVPIAECTEDDECTSNHCLAGTCVACINSDDCDGVKVCKEDHTCGYECTTKDDCDGDKICKEDHTCGYECTTKDDCDDDKICKADHTCAYECTANTDCDGICTDHKCVPCENSDQCDGDLVCENGACKTGTPLDPGTCNVKADCANDANGHVCDDHKCVACVSDDDCDGATPACSNHVCVACTEDKHCADNTNGAYCDTANASCVECLTNDACSDDKVCRSNACAVECETDDQCEADLVCGKNDAMVNKRCVECTSDDNCAGNDKKKACNLSSLTCEDPLCNCKNDEKCLYTASGTTICSANDTCDLAKDSDCDGTNDLADDGSELDACPYNPNIQKLNDGQNCNTNGDTFEIWHATDLNKLREALASDAKPTKIALMSTVNLYDAITDSTTDFSRIPFDDVNDIAITDATCLIKWTPITLPENTDFKGNGFSILAQAPSEADASVLDTCSLTEPLFNSIGANSKVDGLSLDYNVRGRASAMFATTINSAQISNITLRANINIEAQSRLDEPQLSEYDYHFGLLAHHISDSTIQDITYQGNWSGTLTASSWPFYICGGAYQMSGSTIERMTINIDSVNIDRESGRAFMYPLGYEIGADLKDISITTGDINLVKGTTLNLCNVLSGSIDGLKLKTGNIETSNITGLATSITPNTSDPEPEKISLSNIDLEFGDIVFSAVSPDSTSSLNFTGITSNLSNVKTIEQFSLKTGNITFSDDDKGSHYIYGITSGGLTSDLKNASLEFGNITGFDYFYGIAQGEGDNIILERSQITIKTGDITGTMRENKFGTMYGIMPGPFNNLSDLWLEYGNIKNSTAYLIANTANSFTGDTMSIINSTVIAKGYEQGNGSGASVINTVAMQLTDCSYYLDGSYEGSNLTPFINIVKPVTGNLSIYSGIALERDDEGKLVLDSDGKPQLKKNSDGSLISYPMNVQDNANLLSNGVHSTIDADVTIQYGDVKSKTYYGLGAFLGAANFSKSIMINTGDIETESYYGITNDASGSNYNDISVNTGNITTGDYYGIVKTLSYATVNGALSIKTGDIQAFTYTGGLTNTSDENPGQFIGNVSITTGNINLVSSDPEFKLTDSNVANSLYFVGFSSASNFDYINIQGSLSLTHGDITGVSSFNGLGPIATNPHDITITVGNVKQIPCNNSNQYHFGYFNGLAEKVGGVATNINLTYGNVKAAHYVTGFANSLISPLIKIGENDKQEPGCDKITIKYGDIEISNGGDFDGFIRTSDLIDKSDDSNAPSNKFALIGNDIQTTFGNITNTAYYNYRDSVIGWIWGSGSRLTNSSFSTGKLDATHKSVFGENNTTWCSFDNVSVKINEKEIQQTQWFDAELML